MKLAAVKLAAMKLAAVKCIAVTVVAFTAAAGELAAQSTPPNIVMIFSDDQGFHDVGSYGSEIDTPRT